MASIMVANKGLATAQYSAWMAHTTPMAKPVFFANQLPMVGVTVTVLVAASPRPATTPEPCHLQGSS